MTIKLILIISFSVLYGVIELIMLRQQDDKGKISKKGDEGSSQDKNILTI
jgi:hypothetical protein